MFLFSTPTRRSIIFSKTKFSTFLLGHPWTLFRLLSSFQTVITSFTRNKCPSSMQCRDSNSHHSEHDSIAVITWPAQNFVFYKKRWNCNFILLKRSEVPGTPSMLLSIYMRIVSKDKNKQIEEELTTKATAHWMLRHLKGRTSF